MLFILTPCKVKVCLIGKEYRNFGPLSWKTVIQIYWFPLFKAKTHLLHSICQGASWWGIPASWLGIFKYLLLYHGQGWCQGTPQAEPSRLRGWGHAVGDSQLLEYKWSALVQSVHQHCLWNSCECGPVTHEVFIKPVVVWQISFA